MGMNSILLQFLSNYPPVDYGKGQVILRPEQEEKQIFFISTGFVRAHTITEEGNEFSAALLGPGMYFPIFRYISDGTYTKKLTTKYYYSALTKTLLIPLTSADLSDFLRTNNAITTELSTIYYIHMKLLLSKLEFMAYTHSAYKKVCYFLLFLCKKFGQQSTSGINILPPFTHKEFATFVGLSRESVSHQLSLLQKKGILKDVRGSLSIKSMYLLEDELKK